MDARARRWTGFVLGAIVVFAGVVGIAYRRHLTSEAERQTWGRYYLSSETRAILNGGETFELLSVDPTSETLKADMAAHSKENLGVSPTNGAADKPAVEVFHDHRVLGRTEIKDPKKRTQLLATLYRSVEKYRGFGASCFDPRHGIVALAGTNRVELLICFECEQGEEFVGSEQKWFLIGKEPKDLFNRTLKETGVPLAQK